jgi:RsiW-degrading membrane proteinase PrsW (M82 family)
MSLYVAVALSACLAGLLVYRYDLYNREPWHLLVLAAALGALAMRGAGAVETLSLGFVDGPVVRAAIAALDEELARLGVVSVIAVTFRAQFDDPMDGIIYGSIVGLGMAVEESFYLLNLMRAPNVLTLPVELVRLLGHLVMGGIAGFGVGMAAMKVRGWPSMLIRSFAIALAIHFAWDWIALASPDGASLPAGRSFLGIAVMLGGVLAYGRLVVEGARLSKVRFAPASVRSLWGWPFR